MPIGTYIDFTLSNARRFYSSMGNPLGRKGLRAQDNENMTSYKGRGEEENVVTLSLKSAHSTQFKLVEITLTYDGDAEGDW